MIAICVSVCGMNEREKLQMRESLHSMQDLTDDEESPRFGMADLDVRNECRQAVQAFDFGLDTLGLVEDAGMEVSDMGERDQGEAEESERETDQQRRLCYYMATLDEVSEPDLGYEIHAEVENEYYHDPRDDNESIESEESRRRWDLFSERHEVSDVELYDTWFEEIMVENKAIARGEMDEG